MADKFTFSSAGEIQEAEFALARTNWTHALVKKATGGDFFGLVRELVEGRAEICRIERLTAESSKWGTIYRGSHDNLCMRYLYFSDRRWRSDYGRLGSDWDGGGVPAALHVS